MSIDEPITKDGISSLCNLSAPPTEGFTPVLQLIDMQKKCTAKKPGHFVWRLVLSDSMFYCEGCLASNLYHLIDSDLLKKYCFVKLLNHNSTLIGKTIVVVIARSVTPRCLEQRVTSESSPLHIPQTGAPHWSLLGSTKEQKWFVGNIIHSPHIGLSRSRSAAPSGGNLLCPSDIFFRLPRLPDIDATTTAAQKIIIIIIIDPTQQQPLQSKTQQ